MLPITRCHFCKEPARVLVTFIVSDVLQKNAQFPLCFGHVGWIEKIKEAERIVSEFNRGGRALHKEEIPPGSTD